LTKHPIDRAAEDSYVLAGASVPGVIADTRRVLRRLDRRYTNEAADLLGGFDRPALIAWSRDDRFFKPAEAVRLASDLPNAQLEWIDDARSFSPEDQPARLSELIAEFAREPVPRSV
jgi:pimeloyl-ACP methyl ester carboxylesterase